MNRSIRIVAAALAVLLLAGTALGANNFSADANCVALWQFEQTPSGAVDTNDTGPVGTNTLTAVYSPASDTVNI